MSKISIFGDKNWKIKSKKFTKKLQSKQLIHYFCQSSDNVYIIHDDNIDIDNWI